MIRGTTEIIAHIGYPTHTFQSPMIYNPYFEQAGVDAVVVPMGCEAPHFPAFLKAVFTLANIRGALITMPHKQTTVALLDEAAPAVKIAGACNAVRRNKDGRLQGDLFDGEGFVRGARRKGCRIAGARALVVGCGGVGSAIAASLAGGGIAALGLHDARADAAHALAGRLAEYFPDVAVITGDIDPAGYNVVVNATPLGMNDGDPLPLDTVTRSGTRPRMPVPGRRRHAVRADSGVFGVFWAAGRHAGDTARCGWGLVASLTSLTRPRFGNA
jgi:shikimate dehydrogenase